MGGNSLELDANLIRLSAQDFFTVRDACQGVSIFGSIGSGKTSGSGQALASAYLRAGMGGLVLCAKPEEAITWRHYAAINGRQNSLIELDGSRPCFNFLAYELARQGEQGLNSVVECLLRVLEAIRLASPSPGKVGDAFWESTTRQLLRSSLPVIYAATGTLRIPDIIRFVRGAPRTAKEMQDPAWQERSYMFACFSRGRDRITPETGERLINYWRDEFAELDPKTRGNISISLTTALDRFNHGWLQTAFCSETTVVPELCFHGAILLLNMPALTRNEDGIIAQQLVKYMWQRAVLSRNSLASEHQARPVFLWADEAQYFLNSYDAEFLSTCRGSRACTVFLSQSLPTYYAKIGGDNPHDLAHHLLGNFGTKIFHSNSCPETNEWAAKTLGRSLQRRNSFNQSWGSNRSMGMNQGSGNSSGTSSGSSSTTNSRGETSYGTSRSTSHSSNASWGQNKGRGTNEGTTAGYSEQMDYVIEPAHFGSMLKTGGPANSNRVSAVWYQAGRTFHDSSGNALLAEFKQ